MSAADKIITDYGVFQIVHPGHEKFIANVSQSNMTMIEISKDTSKDQVSKILKDVPFTFSQDLKVMEDMSSKFNADQDEWEIIDHFFD